MTAREVFVVRDRVLLREAVVARLVTRLVDLQVGGATVRLLVADDPVTAEVLAALEASPARDAVDWDRLDIWRAEDDPRYPGTIPTFDLAVLGLSADGGVAGLRPESPAVHDERLVAPDPVSGRITVTLRGLCRSREVWLLAAGQETSSALVLTVSDAGPLQVPAAGAVGLGRTLVLADEEAASRLPGALRRLASP